MDDHSNPLSSPQTKASLSGEAEPPSYDAHFPPATTEPSPAASTSTTFRDEKTRPSAISEEGHEPFRLVQEPHRWRRGEYRPSYSLDAEHNISSHDRRLSTDAETLHRFLARHSAAPAQLSLRCMGSTHGMAVMAGPLAFDFIVPASHAVKVGLGKGARPLLYVDGPWALTLRGERSDSRIIEEDPGEESDDELVDAPDQGQRTGGGYTSLGDGDLEQGRSRRRVGGQITLEEGRYTQLLTEQEERGRRGWPRFINPKSITDIFPLASPHAISHPLHPPRLFQSHFVDSLEAHGAPTGSSVQSSVHEDEVREVLEAYCRSRNPLRELRVETEAYGWDFGRLEKAAEDVVKTTGFGGRPQDRFKAEAKLSPSHIVIRPDNPFTRILNSREMSYFWLIVTLIFPIVYLLDYYLGAKFHQIRVAHPLLRWRPLPPPPSSATHNPDSALALARQLAAREPKVEQLPNGEWVYLVGMEEKEWLEPWETAITNAVKERRGQTVDAMNARDLEDTKQGPITLTEEDRMREPLPPSGILGRDTCAVM